jgi:diaminopimelate epimerase
MNTGSHIAFRKMNGLGNDFVILDARARALKVDEAAARAIADRDTGIGCDQLIVLEKSAFADIRMRIWNNEGGEVESCGNASRCIGDILLAEAGSETLSVETKGGLLECFRADGGMISVDMGSPRFHWSEIPLAEEFHDTRAIELQIGPIDAPVLHTPSVVNVGNPHCIFWVDDVNAHDLARFGPMLENHPIFPERANISLAQVESREKITLKVWERGAGLTRACGTAACAVAVAGARKGVSERSVNVSLQGGDLHLEWREEDDHILMTGPVAYEFDGVLPDGILG